MPIGWLLSMGTHSLSMQGGKNSCVHMGHLLTCRRLLVVLHPAYILFWFWFNFCFLCVLLPQKSVRSFSKFMAIGIWRIPHCALSNPCSILRPCHPRSTFRVCSCSLSSAGTERGRLAICWFLKRHGSAICWLPKRHGLGFLVQFCVGFWLQQQRGQWGRICSVSMWLSSNCQSNKLSTRPICQSNSLSSNHSHHPCPSMCAGRGGAPSGPLIGITNH